MREKYILEKHPRWFNFGGETIIDINTKNEKAFKELPSEIIERFNKLVDEHVEAVTLLFKHCPNVAEAWFYGGVDNCESPAQKLKNLTFKFTLAALITEYIAGSIVTLICFK